MREDWEYEVSNIDGIHIPLGELPHRISETRRSKRLQNLLLCVVQVEEVVKQSNFNCSRFYERYNLKGGITAWGKEIDPSIPVA